MKALKLFNSAGYMPVLDIISIYYGSDDEKDLNLCN